MCIYCKTDDYRKIYENHSGSIPKGYEIHHIDGNHSNNIPSNLMAVTAEEHYNLSNGGVRTRIRSNSDRFKGWKYAD